MENTEQEERYKYRLTIQGTKEEHDFFDIPSRGQVEKVINVLFRNHPQSKASIKFWSQEIDCSYFEICNFGDIVPIDFEDNKITVVHGWNHKKKQPRKFDMRTRIYVDDTLHYFTFKLIEIESGKEIKALLEERISKTQYNQEIDEAVERVRKGKSVPHDEAMREIDDIVGKKVSKASAKNKTSQKRKVKFHPLVDKKKVKKMKETFKKLTKKKVRTVKKVMKRTKTKRK